jgi:hypothetical protein
MPKSRCCTAAAVDFAETLDQMLTIDTAGLSLDLKH